jgi:hypothetical protein
LIYIKTKNGCPGEQPFQYHADINYFEEGLAAAVLGTTSPFRYKVIEPPSVLLKTVTGLLNGPAAAALKVAFTEPVLPGNTGSLDQTGVVHPQETVTFERTQDQYLCS